MVTLRQDDAPGRVRFGGYEDALERLGLPLYERLVLRTPPHHDKSYVEAERAVGQLVSSGEHFDGIVCMGDRVALGAVRGLKAGGLTAGKDVLVMGMDDMLFTGMMTLSISTVRRNTDVMAREGAGALLRLLKGEDAHDVIVPYEVVERETTLG